MPPFSRTRQGKFAVHPNHSVYPPLDPEPLWRAFEDGLIGRDVLDELMAKHHPHMCADCGAHIAISPLKLWVSFSYTPQPDGHGRLRWTQFFCRTQVQFDDHLAPQIVAGDYHCIDMVEQVRYLHPALQGDVASED